MEAGVASRGRRFRGPGAAGACALVALVLAALPAATASAGSPTISYPDFSSVAGLTLNGYAARADTALRVAPNTAFEDGSAWAQQRIDTGQSFESQFELYTHDGGPFPADGMTFALQSQGLSALGDTGGKHGYGGSTIVTPVAPSVAVDISLFPQITLTDPEQFSIVENGDLTPLASGTSSAQLYGQPFWVWVDYDATAKSLQVFESQTSTKPATPLVAKNVNLAGVLGPLAYAGFTAASGALIADFDVLSWTFQSTGDSTPPTVTCSAAPAVLWPPNNKLVGVTTHVTVEDAGSGPAGFTLLSVTSNEGSIGSESKDWALGSPDTSGSLQAARNGSGTGRVYTLTYQGVDQAGNTTTCSTTVTVPHDQGS
jgi:hypothetical protein